MTQTDPPIHVTENSQVVVRRGVIQSVMRVLASDGRFIAFLDLSFGTAREVVEQARQTVALEVQRLRGKHNT